MRPNGTLAGPDSADQGRRAVLDARDGLVSDDSIRAVVLTGAGRRAFSAGADIPSLAASIADGPERALREIVRRGHALTRRTVQLDEDDEGTGE
jgi:enoyl-CoA hydratase/carnithine racemase